MRPSALELVSAAAELGEFSDLVAELNAALVEIGHGAGDQGGVSPFLLVEAAGLAHDAEQSLRSLVRTSAIDRELRGDLVDLWRGLDRSPAMRLVRGAAERLPSGAGFCDLLEERVRRGYEL